MTLFCLLAGLAAAVVCVPQNKRAAAVLQDREGRSRDRPAGQSRDGDPRRRGHTVRFNEGQGASKCLFRCLFAVRSLALLLYLRVHDLSKRVYNDILLVYALW